MPGHGTESGLDGGRAKTAGRFQAID